MDEAADMSGPNTLRAPDVSGMATIERQLATLPSADEAAFALCDEWLQLQGVRGFLPRCAMCEETVGPTYLELGWDEGPTALCLGCFDRVAGARHPRPPSDRIERTAEDARRRESNRRGSGSPSRQACWHCGGPADGPVILKVTAVAPERTNPEQSEVCLRCLGRALSRRSGAGMSTAARPTVDAARAAPRRAAGRR